MSSIEMLKATVQARRALDEALDQQVLACRREGVSWAEIAQALGMKKSTVLTKYRDSGGAQVAARERRPDKWDIAPGSRLRRRELHSLYGGNVQSGIAPTAGSDEVLLFTSPAGEQHDYQDHDNSDGTFTYTGEGQRGDQTMTRGNLAIRTHADRGKHLRLFKGEGDGLVTYQGEYEYVTHEPKSLRTSSGRRTIIVFTLRPVAPNGRRSRGE